MLSRLALRQSSLLSVTARALPATSNQSTQSSPPRPVRPEFPSPVRHGFIPEEWFTFFYNKTGVTGPYVLTATLSTYLFSKEIYVCEHEFYNGISFLIIWICVVKKLGPPLAAYLDKEIDAYEEGWEQSRTDKIEYFEENIEDEKKQQLRAGAQQLIMEAKKENIKMQLEAVYRERMAQVYSEVKRRLDYQVQIQNIERRIAQKHMVQWIINNVLKAITPDQEKATLKQCIKDLQNLAATAKV